MEYEILDMRYETKQHQRTRRAQRLSVIRSAFSRFSGVGYVGFGQNY